MDDFAKNAPSEKHNEVPPQASKIAGDFSLSNFAQDLFKKGVVTSISEHPREAVVAAGTAALAIAAIKSNTFRAVSRIFEGGAAELGAARGVVSGTEGLASRGVLAEIKPPGLLVGLGKDGTQAFYEPVNKTLSVAGNAKNIYTHELIGPSPFPYKSPNF